MGYKAFRRICRGRDVFRLSCHANSSIGVDGITSILRGWQREKWIPDVVVIDYADILAPPFMVRESLDQIDVTWKLLRRMSQEFECLLLTATQSNAASYRAKDSVLTRQNFSGRKTKLAHVSGMLGINVTPDDKKKGIIRLNWVVRREGFFNEIQCVPVAGCFAICSPTMRS